MKKVEVDTKVIEEKVRLIERYVGRLEGLQGLPAGKLALPDNFDVAAYNLRSALEATLDIVGHILARIPGAQVAEYKQMAFEMGRQGIVPLEFAENTLAKMAGYRNRLTHFYFEVQPREMYDILQNNLGDFEMFQKHIKKFLQKDEDKNGFKENSSP